MGGRHQQRAAMMLAEFRRRGRWVVEGRGCWEEKEEERVYHQESPCGIVDEDEGCGEEHGEADEFVELVGGQRVSVGVRDGAWVPL